MSSDEYGFSHPGRGQRGTRTYPERGYRLTKEQFDLLAPEDKAVFLQEIYKAIRKFSKTNTKKLTRKANNLKTEHARLWEARTKNPQFEDWYTDHPDSDALSTVEDYYRKDKTRPLADVIADIRDLSDYRQRAGMPTFTAEEINHIINELAVETVLENREARKKR